MASNETYFTPDTFVFLRALKRNNNRDWFQSNKVRYETVVRDPMLRFITNIGPHLARISPHIVADPRPNGGSMFRIYRDTRFSADKSPYKTHAAAHFPVRATQKNVATPGFYLHLEPGGCFVGAGIWHPDSPTLVKIREAIADSAATWKRARSGVKLDGATLSRPPRGFDPNHPFIEDLKRKDFVTGASFTDAQVVAPTFITQFAGECRRMSPLVAFLAMALGRTY
jgi:uncharacterized protein (TIGR02453 family)